MDKQTEIALADELGRLARNRECFLDEGTAQSPVWKYISEDHFALEQRRIFRRLPQIVAHSSELREPHSFLRRQAASGLPLLLTRDEDGRARAFLNVCRHRGARLVDDEAGCRQRLTCPYHAWSYSSRGDLLSIPHEAQGFPDINKSEFGLRSLPCEERWGWIFLGSEGAPLDLNAWLGELALDLESMGAEDLEIKQVETHTRNANWKILIEGGLEAYHFKVVHRNTIGPHFPNNLSSYQSFGDHLRSILPRAGVEALTPELMQGMALREKANILYTLFPLSNLLIMPDHLVWIHNEPLSAGQTRLRIATLAARDSSDSERWLRNNHIAQATLAEDGEIGESVQSGLASGANDCLQFGRFEGALAVFNATIDRQLTAD